MKMYLYTTGEDFARAKWGDAYVAALREYTELVLNPYVDLEDGERRQHKRHLRLLKARGEAERLERKHQATLQRQADRKQRRAAVKALLKARGLRELADHPLVLDYGTNGVGDLEATVDVLGRGIALKAAFEARQLEPLPESLTDPPAIDRVLPPDEPRRGRGYETMARAFVATGAFDGSAITADQVAAVAQEQTARTSEVRALVAKVKAKVARQLGASQFESTQDLLSPLNSTDAYSLVTVQFLSTVRSYIQRGPTAVVSTGRREDALDVLRAKAREAVLSTTPTSRAHRQAEIDAVLQKVWEDGAPADDEPEAFTRIFEFLAHDKAMYVRYGDGPKNKHTLKGIRETAERLVAERLARCEQEAFALRRRADADEPVCWQIVDYTAALPETKTGDAWLMRFNFSIRPLDQHSRLVALDNFCSHGAKDAVRRSDIPKVFRPFLAPRRDW